VLKILTVIDEYSRESLAILGDHRINSDGVLNCLMDLFSNMGFRSTSAQTMGPNLLLRRSGADSGGSESRPY
jgi:hypothetical protein